MDSYSGDVLVGNQTSPFGRVVRRTAPDLINRQIIDADLEILSIGIRVAGVHRDVFIASGEEIREVYTNCIAGSSCMTGPDKAMDLDLYVDNPGVVAMAVGRIHTTPDSDTARALLWLLDDGRVYMDRVYSLLAGPEAQFAMTLWAQSHGLVWRTSRGEVSGKRLLECTVQTKKKQRLPYLDTFRWASGIIGDKARRVTLSNMRTLRCQYTSPFLDRHGACYACGGATYPSGECTNKKCETRRPRSTEMRCHYCGGYLPVESLRDERVVMANLDDMEMTDEARRWCNEVATGGTPLVLCMCDTCTSYMLANGHYVHVCPLCGYREYASRLRTPNSMFMHISRHIRARGLENNGVTFRHETAATRCCCDRCIEATKARNAISRRAKHHITSKRRARRFKY